VRLKLWPSRTLVLLPAAVLVCAPSCKKAGPPGEQGPEHVVDAAPVRAVPYCAEVKPGAVYLIGEPGQPASRSEDEEIALPSAVELGSAVGYSEGFAVAALSWRDQGPAAVVALLSADGSRGRTVELGRVHGNVAPPQLASGGGHLVALVADSDAGGRRLRLARVAHSAPRPDVQWGAELSPAPSDAQGFGLALAGSRAVVVWDEWAKGEARGLIRATTVALADITKAGPVRTVSADNSDGERPEVVARPGGYWLGWISHSAYAAGDQAAADAARSGAAHPPPSAEPGAEAFEPVVDLGSRWLEVVPLSADGAPSGPPQVVTSQQSHVLVFDLAPAPDGSLWLAWRDDKTSPGVEQGALHLARVGLDGALDKSVVEDEQLGAGVPSLLVDRAAGPGRPSGWLASRGIDDTTHIGTLDARGRLRSTLLGEPLIRGAEPLALWAGRMLLGRPRGRAVELSVVSCRETKRAGSAARAPVSPRASTERP
jgi:hypothetical protein